MNSIIHSTRVLAGAVALCLVVFPGRANAAVVGSDIGSTDLWIADIFHPTVHAIQCWLFTPVPGSETWDVFGVSAALGPVLCTMETISGVTGDIQCKSVDPDTYSENGLVYASVNPASQAAGTAGCLKFSDIPGHTSECEKSSTISTFSAVSGSLIDQLTAQLPPGSRLVHTSDQVWVGNAYGVSGATSGCGFNFNDLNCAATIPGCPSPAGVHVYGNGTGRSAHNAFIDEPTDVGSNVTISSTTAFYNPLTLEAVPITVDVTFGEVTTAGRTMVVVQSNHDTGLGGFRLTSDSFYASFLDITTTAQYTGMITICTRYPDADNDGLVDGTTTSETEFRFLHGENGNFVDRTSSRDVENNLVCGTVEHLSPFVGTVPEPCSPTPLENCARGKGKLQIVRNPADSRKDSLKYTLQKSFSSNSIPFSLGNPDTKTDYRLCVYDNEGLNLETLLLAGHAESWKRATASYKYKDKTGTNQGITSISLKGSSYPDFKFNLKGKGSNLRIPTRMPFALDGGYWAQVQLINEKGVCFDAFLYGEVNSATKFKAD